MRIAVLANLKVNAPIYEGMPADRWDDLDGPDTMAAIVAAFEALGHEAQFFESSILPPHDLIGKLRDFRPEMCFNLSEGHFGTAREAHIPSLLEMLELPYSGSGPLGLALALDKTLTKRVLQSYGLPTPEFQLFESAQDELNPAFLNEDGALRYPLIAKPNAEGTSMGVSASSIVETVADLRLRVAAHLQAYRQPILVERFLEGRELLVGMIGNGDDLLFLPALELKHAAYGPEHPNIYSSELKHTYDLSHYIYDCPAHLSATQLVELQRLAAATFHATHCRDVARVDFRLDAAGNPYILEINPLPGLTPEFSDLCLEALGMGWDHTRLVNAILAAAVARYAVEPV
jgi:D-alanine-D-alanine ligase